MEKAKTLKFATSGNGNGKGNRSEVVSKPGAAIKVERLNLTKEERESLSVNTRFLDIEKVRKAA